MPVILRWLDSVPESAWEHLDAFAVGNHGEFVAEFSKVPDRGGPRRKVRQQFDHNSHTVRNDIGMWAAPTPQPFHPDHLYVVVNAF